LNVVSKEKRKVLTHQRRAFVFEAVGRRKKEKEWRKKDQADLEWMVWKKTKKEEKNRVGEELMLLEAKLTKVGLKFRLREGVSERKDM
jgi:hypothetical protein